MNLQIIQSIDNNLTIENRHKILTGLTQYVNLFSIKIEYFDIEALLQVIIYCCKLRYLLYFFTTLYNKYT